MRNPYHGGSKRSLFAKLLLIPGLTLLASRPASGASTPVLVELFTSEGCSSCPPADQLLMQLDSQQPVPGATIVVLSEHVDYWNSLGWRDPYSSHQWSERQDAYGRRFNLESVYTPQMVIDGSREANGSDSRSIRKAIEVAAASSQVPITISTVEKNGAQLTLEFSAGSGNAVIYAVVADDSDRSTVERGENAGHTLEHVAVARSLVRIGELQPAPLDKKVQIRIAPDQEQRHLRLVVFAQNSRTGRIVGVAAREL